MSNNLEKQIKDIKDTVQKETCSEFDPKGKEGIDPFEVSLLLSSDQKRLNVFIQERPPHDHCEYPKQDVIDFVMGRVKEHIPDNLDLVPRSKTVSAETIQAEHNIMEL